MYQPAWLADPRRWFLTAFLKANYRTMPKPQYTQKFRNAWLKDPSLKEWLLVIDSTLGREAKCKFCSKILTSRYADLKSHGESKKHKENASVFSGRSLQGKVQQKIPFTAVTDQEDTKSAEGRLALFIAQHSSINISDHLIDMCKKAFINCSVSKNMQMHRTKCSNLIKNVLSPHFVRELCEDIGNSPFSILLDESTDITVDKYLGCTIIYFSYKTKQIVNSFLDLVELENCDANAIVDAVLETLKNLNSNLANLKGIGTDIASVMVGINNAVYAKLKERVPNLILIRCVCRSLQLAVTAAAKECLPRNLEFLIRETYNWFQHSSSRQIKYRQLYVYNTINEGNDPLKITGMSATRWLSIESAVTRIFDQWVELKTHFSIVKDSDKCYTAQMLYEMYKDDTNYAFICFPKPILGEVQRVNKAFEAKNAESCKQPFQIILR
ncbi:unnamed protein product [Acanthoscelides obtectus]|uniref:DUF4371 domain-containing protein n=1 Tax=Acanthoscelides obtectus TaxID=200917 RepID=A0A9P0PHY9_ACAOB|nr:unnamed protein product [Acanthoscelides obtectus]CAK1680975.1 Zinc finger protein 862 [Acanthoscelides obtectus]